MRLHPPFLSSLRSRLVLLVLFAVVPALVVVLQTASVERRNAEHQVRENLLRFTKFSAANQKQATEATRQLLITLSELPEVRNGDGVECNLLLAKLLNNYQSYVGFGVVDAAGNVTCSAPISQKPITIANRTYFQMARDRRNFSVGNYQIGQLTGKATLNFGYPIFDRDGQVQAVIFAALALDRLERLASEVQLPEGSLLTVLDRNGTILVRSIDPEQWVGKSFPNAPLTRQVLAQPEGVVESLGFDGVERLYAFTTLGSDAVNQHIHVLIGVPRAIAFADANRLLTKNLIALGIVTLLALAAAWFGGDLFLIRKVKSFVNTAQQIRSGNLSARTGFTNNAGELAQLASAIDEMAETLEHREQQRKQTEDELKQAAAELQQSEERYRYLAETIPQLVWAATPEGMLLDVNQRWSDFTGLTLEEVQTYGWEAIVHPDDGPTLNQNWVAAQQAGGYYRAEGRMRRADGAYRWHLHEAIPLKNERGQIIKWFGTATDIEAQKQIEHQRQRLLEQEQAAREQAETANRIKDEFLAVLSHELRSPLNPILGWAKLLRDGKLDSTRAAYAIETIERNAKLQVQLIDDLLDISRILRGKLALTIQPVDLKQIITAALETVRLAAEAKSLDLQFTVVEINPNAAEAGPMTALAQPYQPSLSADIQNHPIQVLGDAGRLQQVVWNLVSNAVKFTPNGGSVRVELCASDTWAQIQVKDTGKGINPDFLPFVFEHFRQEDGATTRKFGGLGLGLAIVRQIAEMHGGTVRVESSGEGQGATFTVQIPLAPTLLEPLVENNASGTLADLSAVQILVVDDDVDSRAFITFVLQQANAIVRSAASGEAALRAIAESVPDLVLSDIGMPDMDGYTLMRRIRALPPEQGGRVRAIALTAYAGETNQQQALDAGFQKHIAKPVESETLIRAIAQLMGKDLP